MQRAAGEASCPLYTQPKATREGQVWLLWGQSRAPHVVLSGGTGGCATRRQQNPGNEHLTVPSVGFVSS